MNKMDILRIINAANLIGYEASQEWQANTPRTGCDSDSGPCVFRNHISTGWCPPVISWFKNPINYSYIYHKP